MYTHTVARFTCSLCCATFKRHDELQSHFQIHVQTFQATLPRFQSVNTSLPVVNASAMTYSSPGLLQRESANKTERTNALHESSVGYDNSQDTEGEQIDTDDDHICVD